MGLGYFSDRSRILSSGTGLDARCQWWVYIAPISGCSPELSVSCPQAFADQTMAWDFYGTDGFLKLKPLAPSHVKLVGLTSRCFPYFHPQPQTGLDTNIGPGIRPPNLLYLQKDLHWGVLVSPPSSC